LIFFVSAEIGELLAVTATILEVIFALLMLVGYKTRLIAFLSGILLVLFAITMTIALGIKSTFSYSVWIGVGACLLLSSIDKYDYSLDKYIKYKYLRNEKSN